MKPANLVYAFPEEIALDNTQAVIKAGQAFLSKSPAGDLVLDLKKLTLMNSLAIGVMIKLNNLFKQKGRGVVLKNVSNENLRVLESTGLVNLFPIMAGDDQIPPDAGDETVSLNIDFDIDQNIGVFRFTGGMPGTAGTGLYLNTLDKIIHDKYKMLVDISQLVSSETVGAGAVEKLKAVLADMGENIRIFCANPEVLSLLRQHGLPESIRVFGSRGEAVKGWM